MAATTPWEFERLVKGMKPLDLKEAGGESWHTQASGLESLSVGAVLEAGGGGEEVVARMMVDEDKVLNLDCQPFTRFFINLLV